MDISTAVYQIFDLIILLMLIRILLTWIPNINWYSTPMRVLDKITGVFLNPFRNIIPPIGMFDISPIVAFIAVRLIQVLLCSLLRTLGL